MTSARVAAVWCPDWPIATTGAPAGAAVAVVAAGKVVACSAAAREEGVRRGQRLRDAQGRCPGLLVHDEDPDAQARLFEPVVAVVEERCPRVEVVRPGICAVPARGPARYFGGERKLATLLHEAITDTTGFDSRVGIADGLLAAILAARASPGGADDGERSAYGDGRCVIVPSEQTVGFLARHPVNVLERPELAGLLVRLGVPTLGDFAALPSDQVLARFGTDGAAAHRLARGLEPRLLAPRQPARELTVQRVFEPPVEQFEQVVFTAKSLADELHANLAASGVSCVRVEVEVATQDGRRWSRMWRHDGLLSATAVAERVRWQLDAWRTNTSADEALTGGLVLLRLVPDQLVTDGGRQLALWGETAPDERVDRAATRVQTMLGRTAVTQPVLGGGRGPVDQVTRIPWGEGTTLPRTDSPWPGHLPPPAPAVVYPQPPRATVVGADDKAVSVDGRCMISAPPDQLTLDGSTPMAIVGWAGPWPVHEYWWDETRSERSVRFQVVTDDGHAWLLTRRVGQWYVEATY